MFLEVIYQYIQVFALKKYGAQIESFLSQYSLLEFFLQSRKYLGIKTDEYQISLETSQFPDSLFCQTQTILWLFFLKPWMNEQKIYRILFDHPLKICEQYGFIQSCSY